MKNFLKLLSLFVLTFTISACGNTTSNQKVEVPNKMQADIVQKPASKSKILVVYYSRSENTAELARQIQQRVGGDIMQIQTVQPYPTAYNDVTKQAKEELEAGFKPEIKPLTVQLGDYDTIYLGSPIWWGTIATPVITFLTQNDLSGKTIMPFVTHEGSGISRSVDNIKELSPRATVMDGLAVRGSSVKNATNDITNWLKK